MRPWKKLEEWIANFLEWERITKKHYGDSVPDLRGDGYTGDSKHYKRFHIHTVKQKADMLYKEDIIIFTKEKKTHYEPYNILATMSLNILRYLLECKRIAEKVDKKTKDVNNNNGKLTSELRYLRNVVKTILQKLNKMLKEVRK